MDCYESLTSISLYSEKDKALMSINAYTHSHHTVTDKCLQAPSFIVVNKRKYTNKKRIDVLNYFFFKLMLNLQYSFDLDLGITK